MIKKILQNITMWAIFLSRLRICGSCSLSAVLHHECHDYHQHPRLYIRQRWCYKHTRLEVIGYCREYTEICPTDCSLLLLFFPGENWQLALIILLSCFWPDFVVCNQMFPQFVKKLHLLERTTKQPIDQNQEDLLVLTTFLLLLQICEIVCIHPQLCQGMKWYNFYILYSFVQ